MSSALPCAPGSTHPLSSLVGEAGPPTGTSATVPSLRGVSPCAPHSTRDRRQCSQHTAMGLELGLSISCMEGSQVKLF